MEKTVVLGGSFNPPTTAHLQLIRSAMEAINACRGIFVPTSHDYVEKKMKRQKCAKDTLGDSIRLEMLESLCRSDERLFTDSIQMRKVTDGSDYEMLRAIRKDFPDSQIYLVTGSDKLYILPRWKEIDDLLREFRVLVAKRGEDDLEEIKKVRPYLAEH